MGKGRIFVMMFKLAALAGENSMSSTPKIAVITAASIGIVLTQCSSLLAENQDRSEVTKIAAPIDLDEGVLYSTLPDEVLEKAAAFGVGACSLSVVCTPTAICNQGQRVKKPPYSSAGRSKRN
jgi:hypothetical protein